MSEGESFADCVRRKERRPAPGWVTAKRPNRAAPPSDRLRPRQSREDRISELVRFVSDLSNSWARRKEKAGILASLLRSLPDGPYRIHWRKS